MMRSTEKPPGSAWLPGLLDSWAEESHLYDRRGQCEFVAFIESMTADVERAHHAWESEPLELSQAAAESGYSTDQLRRHIKGGKIPNAGPEHSPRVLRRDLPRKPGHGIALEPTLAPTCRTQAARVIATRED